MERKIQTRSGLARGALRRGATQRLCVVSGMFALTLGVAACGSDEGGTSARLPLEPTASAGQGGGRQVTGQAGSSERGPTTSDTSAGGASTSEMPGAAIGLAGSFSGEVTGTAGGSSPGGNAGASLGGSATIGGGGSTASSGAGAGGAGVGEPAAFAPCPDPATPCAIMPLGDSITFGIGSSGGGYRVELFRQALANQQNVTFVGTAPPNGPNQVNGVAFPPNHQGHPGFTISGGGSGSLAGLVDAAIATTSPNIVLLMIGTNDINGNINVAQAPARLGALIDQITNDAPDALLVVGQIIPTTSAQTNTGVQAYNAAIPGLVQARAEAGKHVVVVDLFTPFISNPNFAGIMNDGLHPNDTGYVVLGQAWHEAIDAFLPRTP
jgi:lysophospholipase L1-like esterase